MTNQIMTKSNAEARALMEKAKWAMELVPPEALIAWVKVIMFGAYKYAPDNWRGMMLEGQQYQFLSAIQRHALKIQMGEVFDLDTGLPHAAHIMCNASMLTWDVLATPEQKAKWEHMRTNAKESLVVTPETPPAPVDMTAYEAQKSAPADIYGTGDRVLFVCEYGKVRPGTKGTVLGRGHASAQIAVRLDGAALEDDDIVCFPWRVRMAS